MQDKALHAQPTVAHKEIHALASPGKQTQVEQHAAAAAPAHSPNAATGKAPPRPGQYVVRRGDTLWGISQRHHVSLGAVIASNPQIRDPNRIYPGQRIALPAGNAAPPSRGAPAPGHETDHGQLPAPVERASASSFLTRCAQQVGDRYVFGAETNLRDANPNTFDCSELIEWGCAQVGVPFVDGSSNQIGTIRRAGRAISVDEARRTPGALLHREGHVAISTGTGNETVEARGRAYGVVRYIIGNRFTSAGLIPGLHYDRNR
jgi:spore coat assembly protein SafA